MSRSSVQRVPRALAALLAVACTPASTEPARLPGAAVSVASARAPTPSAPAPPALPPIEPIHAPFPMAAPARPAFPPRTFDVTDFGAVADGATKNTDAFRRAVAAAVNAGGGTIRVPPGRWLTGPIHLESNLNLHLEEGAELLFSRDFADYLPPVFTRWEGLEVYNYSPLIYAKDCTNVAVTGRGKLDGQGQAWWPWKRTQREAAARLYELASAGTPVEDRVFGVEGGLRPSFVQTVGCTNVLIEGVTLTNGPMWTIHPVYSENVIVRDVKVITEGPNNDGCNPDSSRNVLIEDSFFSTGDDCVVIKSGLNEDGWRVGRPSENIVVRRLKGELGHGGVVIGSEMSGGVRNVYVTDSEFKGTDRGLRIKSMRGRGGVVENVFYENVRHRDIRLMVVELTTFYASSTLEPKTRIPPLIRNVRIRNVVGYGAEKAMEIIGLPEAPIQDVIVENSEIKSKFGARCVDCEDVRYERVSLEPEQGVPFAFERARRVSVDGSCSASAPDCVALVGPSNVQITVDGRTKLR
jgi:hypothetical protein